MNRKTLIISVILALACMAGLIFAVSRLYSERSEAPSSSKTNTHFIEDHRLIEAVPSDAAMVFCFKDFRRACEYLGDTSAVFRKLASDKFNFITEESYASLRKSKAILSTHFSRDLPPLLIVSCPPGAIKEAADSACAADTSYDVRRFVGAATLNGLSWRIDRNLILLSTSETVIASSVRHLKEGHSVLESKGFPEVASKMCDDDALLFNNAYSANLFDNFIGKKHRKVADFVREQSDWTGWSISKHGTGGVTMRGEILYSDDPAYYMNILESTACTSTVAEAVPASAMFVASLPVKSFSRYLKAHRNYLDSKIRLEGFEAELANQKKTYGENAEEWGEKLDIKEVALLEMSSQDETHPLLLVKSGSHKARYDSIRPGYLRCLFGEIFTAGPEDSCAVNGDWLAIGSAACVRQYSQRFSAEGSLRERLADNGLSERLPAKDCGFWGYYCMNEDPSLTSNFSRNMAAGCKDILRGAQFVPVTLAAYKGEYGMSLSFSLDRTAVTKMKVTSASEVADTSIAVPEGPFKVRNCLSGEMNTLYQNSHLSICLKDENGKDLWGVPFKEKFCGFVQEVDYFNNGKIQFLFAAGNKLYLIDRLGRFVSGFPVDLGKRVALGPVVHDFTGAKGYTAMLLFRDNTVGYIDLHGRNASGWKGITSGETIKSVPELLEADGKRYWIVRTSRQAMLYPFDGGEPLIKGEGKKLILPDSQFTPDGGDTFRAKCYDGKERAFGITIKENK
ncbi:MAG: hypothetical protein ACI4TJ_00350 [Candidatus Cryptobacteroides sp.]